MNLLETPIEYLKGVGPQRGDLLRKELGIHKYADLLNLFPNRYIDRTRYYKINELQNSNSEVQIVGKIINIKTVEQGKGRSRLVATFVDDTGQMELVWFQGQKWIRESIKINIPYVIFGKVTQFGATYNMAHPEMELLEEHKASLRSAMQPVYPSTEKLGNKGISNKVINKMMQQLFVETQALFSETLPNYLLDELKLIPKNAALFNIHFPKSQDLLAKAQFRLKFEELFFIQLQLITKNLIRKHKIKGMPFEKVGENFTDFYNNHLPFDLTNAQKRVLKEIRNDLGSNAQMNRLLQGDVGSGKTIVALMCMLLAKDNGFQSCLMAPTEILANQHFNGITELAKELNINIKILTGSTKTSDRKIIHEELENGTLDILIGTHALLEDKVQFHNLGLAIIDEQHRFGVEQRSKLWKKNDVPPHVLVMTATPIPRTLAMSLYGDLDISVIDELPPGRKPIQTVHRYDSNRLKVWKFLKDEIAKGRQIYIVYPLIQESEKMDYKDLMDGYESISRDFPLPQYSISIVHGKMKPADKDEEMRRFSEGKTNIMVATTVIEVGVNVPNASVMVIESAERFGLSQLHQLRGRVGRGAEQSYCILMTSHKLSNDSKIRMETMVRTNDGFEISEVDLKLRGPGDIMGKQQSGVLNLQIADLVKDKDILQLARHHAIKLLKEDAPMEKPEHAKLREAFIELSKKKTIWNYIS
ncbi:ATP-dependent DNA helicase RecG [Flavobacterium sp. UBA7663]|uniref:ATP-dependent DNA helicase RecG n=1 Tax=Flavobacterium sp. UBA7663 TaxID=1946557 RepID=UPI0025BDD023|nr:ATP-dependent DNA helicase RecG [Flavobacterium sp. UBA7663]